jgi:hypothetical protein
MIDICLYTFVKAHTKNSTAMPTLFLTRVPKTYDGEKTVSSTNLAGKSSYLPAKN